ncbi:MAG: FdhF/YdeP family oxidoreductase [Candidatus Thalassarchaeaceae archaeon]
MSDTMREQVNELTPIENSPPKLGKPKLVAAGIPGVLASMSHSMNNNLLSSIFNLSKVNRFHGFDCPGCAWPDPDNHRSRFEFCENGAKAVADERSSLKANPKFWSKWPVNELSTKSDNWLNKRGRITHPMVLMPNSMNYTEITWKEAFGMIADELASLDDTNKAIFYTSGRTSNEAAFLWQLLARWYGTNNLPDCSNMCHESSGVALTESIGIGKGTVKLDDFNKADLIIVIGQNPGTNHPRMLSALSDAKKSGASIISINPLKETGMVRFKHPQKPLDLLGSGRQISDEHVTVNINGDMALFRGFSKVIIESNSFHREFIEEYTKGFDNYVNAVENTDWDEIVKQSGIHIDDIKRLGKIISKSKSTIVCWAMGITQHKNSVATIQEIVNLQLLGGHIGRPGAGICPVRGHSNVQGDRTVGINHKPNINFLNSLEENIGIKAPQEHGVDTVGAVKLMQKSNSVFISMGGNFLSAMSDTKITANALRNCNLTVQISTKPNRSHLVTGKKALILPCLGRTEIDQTTEGIQFVSVENSMGIVHSSQGNSKPISSSLKSEIAIVTGIALALEKKISRNKINWQFLSNNYDNIRNLIASCIGGFENYNSLVRKDGGFYLPNNPRDNLSFDTKSGKAEFISHKITSKKVNSNEFLMMTIRSHDQYNTTIYGLNDRYRGISNGRRIIFMNPEDITKNNLEKFQLVDITSHFNGKKRFSEKWFVVPYDIPQNNVATYFPESNSLIPLESVADKSNTPTSKSVVVTINKSKI